MHVFRSVAFAENFNLKELAAAYPEGQRSPRQIHVRLAPGSDLFLYPFGAVTFHNVPPDKQEEELARLPRVRPSSTGASSIAEELSVQEQEGERSTVSGGVLRIDQLTPGRTGIVALTVAQSASMEYFERIVDQMFAATDKLAADLERAGTVSPRTRPLHRFIGATIGTRAEVLTVLHLLDKPDETWEDPIIDRIYADLRSEFDLGDRYSALAMKLRSVQEALELLVDIARDRRLLLLEATVVLLIALEILLGWIRLRG